MFDFNGRYKKAIDHKIGYVDSNYIGDTMNYLLELIMCRRYYTYLNFIEGVGTQLGFKMSREVLRIPTTKNIAFVGLPQVDKMTDIDEQRRIVLTQEYSGSFTPRVSDSVRHRMLQLKKAEKSKKKDSKATSKPDYKKAEQQDQNNTE
jgi:hypothetical protein